MLPHIAAAESVNPLQGATFGDNPELVERTREILQEAGLSPAGLKLLNAKSIQLVTGLLRRGEKHGDLVVKIFNAVTETNPQRLAEVVGKLSVYTGSFPILAQFLECVGHRDPFVATSSAQLLILPANDVPTTRGASGHILKGLTYCAYAPDAPANSVGYFSKKQAITKIFEAFNPERMTADTQGQVRNRRGRALKEELKNITLTELENSETALAEIGSPLLARNMEVYRELRAAIEQCHERLSELVYGGEIVVSGLKSFKVSEDPGRQFFGWFEEHIKENKNVPRGIVLAYQSLKDPDIHLSDAEERNYVRGLLAYQRLHSYINKSVALGGLQKDLEEYAKLGVRDPLRLDEAVHQARTQIQQFAAEGSTEITLGEFARVLELSGMVAFRREMNQRLINIYGESLNSALDRFSFVSFRDGKWREDALEDSVPMDRLKLHLYGAKIGGVDTSRPEKKQAVLGQRDFRAIADYQFLTRLVSDREKFLTAMPITDFRAMVHGVVAADRKAAFLDQKLDEFRQTPKGAAAAFDKENVGDALKDWHPRLLIGRYAPVEIEKERVWEVDQSALPMQEVGRRLVARSSLLIPYRHSLRKEFDKQRFEIENAVAAGLCTEESEDLLGKVQKAAGSLIPVEDHSAEIERAARLFAHPMVVNSGFGINDVLKHRYMLQSELDLLRDFLRAESDIQAASIGGDASFAKNGAKARELNHARFLTGSIVGDTGGRRLSVSDRNFDSYAPRYHFQGEKVRVEYFKPAEVAHALSEIEGKFIKLDEIPNEWFSRASQICSFKGRDALRRAGLEVVDTPTFNAVRTLRSYANTYVSREFYDQINRIAEGGK